MVTRLESGQIQLRSAGGVAMVQAQQPQVDFVGPRVAAQGASQLAQILDRMSSNTFQTATGMRQDEALEYARDNKLSDAQLLIAKGEQPEGFLMGPKGETKPIPTTRSAGYFGQALAKARSIEIATHFEREGRNELVKLLAEINTGEIAPDEVQKKIEAVVNGYSKSELGRIDPEAMIKFRATMYAHGNTVMNKAYEKEAEKTAELKKIAYDLDFDNKTKLVSAEIERGFWSDGGVKRSINDLIELHRKDIAFQSAKLGNAAIQKEYKNKFEEMVSKEKVNVGTKLVLSEEFMANPNTGTERILKGDLGKFSDVWAGMTEVEKKSVRDNFGAAVSARKQGITDSFFASEQQGNTILRKIYMAPSVGEMNNLFKQLDGLPVSPSLISAARSFIKEMAAPPKERDDIGALGVVTSRIAAGVATPSEIINGPFTPETKRMLIQQQSNPNNSINFAIQRINSAVNIQEAGLPPEFADAKARELAIATRNNLAQQLYDFSRTPDASGRLPDNASINKKSQDLAKQANSEMSVAFQSVAETNKNSAVLMVPQLQGVDLNDEVAVSAAIAKATAKKVDPNTISAARRSIESYRKNTKKLEVKK